MKPNEILLLKSKHSHYQSIHPILKDKININVEYEFEKMEYSRAKYINENIKIHGKNICDIGANTGYFTFEAIQRGAKTIDAYEGNKNHAEFISRMKDFLPDGNIIKIFDSYFDFDKNTKTYDILFCLNVLHHLGDDFGDTEINIESAKEKISKAISKLCTQCETLVLQIGFNWKGNRNSPLFRHGTKKEMIEFVKESLMPLSDLKIGIYEDAANEYIEAQEKANDLLKRRDDLGEFLNRPIFIIRKNQPN